AANPLHGSPTTKSTSLSLKASNSTAANSASPETAAAAGSALGGAPCSLDEGRRINLRSLASAWRPERYLFSLEAIEVVPTHACAPSTLATIRLGPADAP